MDEFQIQDGVSIQLKKRIPVAAGMAGGSSDGAAVLWGINQMYGLGLSMQALMERGVRLGADVPYCIQRGTALAEGIGEKLSVLPPMPKCTILIAKPGISVSTKFVYENLHAIGSMMSGSGPTVFGIFDSPVAAKQAMKAVRAAKLAKQICLTTPYNVKR